MTAREWRAADDRASLGRWALPLLATLAISTETERAQLGAALASQADHIRVLHDAISQNRDGKAELTSSAVDPLSEAGRSLAEQGVPRSDPRRRLLRALFNLDGALTQLDRQLADA